MGIDGEAVRSELKQLLGCALAFFVLAIMAAALAGYFFGRHA